MSESNQGGLAAPKLGPKHTIFLSHSGDDKPFVHQLCADLEELCYFPFFDQRRESLPIGEEFPGRIVEAARTCEVAVVVLSEGFVTSKWPMMELIEFVDAMKPRFPDKPNPNYNPNLKLVPVFYKLSADVLKPDLLGGLWKKLVQKLGNNATRLRFDEEKYAEAIGKLLRFNGLTNMHGKNETKYRKEVVTQILQLVPPALPADTSGIQGWERMCQCIFEMFQTKDMTCKGKPVQRKYLGLFGRAGMGKTTICCEAMCNFYQERYRGRFCRVKLDSEKSGEGKSADGQAAATKRRLGRLMAVVKQLAGLPQSMSTIMSEAQGKRYLRDHLNYINRPVFLVVDNVSGNTQDEAKWYASCEFPADSFVLVTSRRCDLLENVLEDLTYCKPFPILDRDEARRLFLSNAAPSNKSLVTASDGRDIIVEERLTPEECEVVEACLQRCCADNDVEFIPRTLTTFASFLNDKGSILRWKEYLDYAGDVIGQEYDALDDTSKLILLDLAVFANDMPLTHMDFHGELEWKEADNFKLTIEFLAMLHGVPFHYAEKKVNDLRHSFLNDSDISVSDDCSEIGSSGITRAGNMKKWCMLCMDVNEETYEELSEVVHNIEYFYDLPNKDSSELVRVGLFGVSFDKDLHRISDWGSVKLLCMHSVQNMSTLNLRDLRSLHVLRVMECDDLERIVCTCNSLFTDNQSCYEKNRGCLSELRVAELQYLPRLKKASFVMHSRRLETLWFYECPNLERYPDLSLCRKLNRLRLPCGDFQGFKGLRNNHNLTELGFHWEADTVRNFTEEMRVALLLDVMKLENLRVLDIVDENKMYDWIPAGFQLNLGNLKFLTFLDLSCSSTIQKVEGLEQLSELTSLGLYGCCELRELPHPGRFRKLSSFCIAHCHNLNLAVLEEYYGGNFETDVEVTPFHALGESCSLGAHECLSAELNLEVEFSESEDSDVDEDSDSNVDEDSDSNVDEDSDSDSDDELQASQVRSICRQCHPRKWVNEYLAKDEGFVPLVGKHSGKNTKVSTQFNGKKCKYKVANSLQIVEKSCVVSYQKTVENLELRLV